MKRKIPILDLVNKYIHCLIRKFTLIAKRARLTSERLNKMIIGDSIIAQKKDILIKKLYNREVVLA